jgi:endonuclease/exonuclease/phosphatase family metal-dependent hydrolase
LYGGLLMQLMVMTPRLFTFQLAGLFIAVAGGVHAYELAGPGTPVIETFESYAGTAAPNQWTLGSGPVFRGSGDGSSNSGGWWSYGSASSTERAPGFLGNSTINTITWTAHWTNSIGVTVDDLALAYRAERWRQAPRPSALSVAYSLNGGGYTIVPELACTAPTVGAEAATDGNNAANFSNLTATLSGLSLAPGGVFSLRWTYTQGAGSGARQGLAIDDVSVTVGAGAFLGFNSPAITVSETSSTNVVWITGFGISAATAEVFVISGTATPDVDYSFVPVTIAFDEITSSQAVEIVMLDDIDIEGSETIVLGITNVSGAVISPGGGAMTINLLDDEYPTASWSPASTSLSEAGTAQPVYVELSFTNHATVQIKASGSAQPGIDYTLSATTLLFVAEGATSNFIEITPLQDGIGESNETIRLSFYDVAGASTGTPSECFITLIDDEPGVSVSPSEIIFTENDTDINLTVSLTSPADATVRVAVAGTAGLNSDFLLSETTLVFTAGGSASTQLQLSAVIDDLAEGPERAVLQLVNADGAVISTNSASQLGLRDANSISMMAANISSGGARTYEAPGQRIFRALLPDVVAIQEFTPATGTRRAFIDASFGTSFYFFVESEGGDGIPNGIISRWPIIASGEWSDSVVSDRDFAWATIDIPGPRNLHVVSVHLYASGTPEQRDSQAQVIVNQIQAQFPDDDFIVVGGDFNTQTRSEAAVSTLGAVVSDQFKPVDQLGDQDTNASRNKPLDYVLPNDTLDTYHRPVNLQGQSFSEGLVFDTRIWTNPPYPSLVSDAATVGMQHMPVVKLFILPTGLLLGPGVVRLEEVGNGDGLLGTGETVRVHFSVRNEGTLDASNLTLEATSLNSSLTFTNPYEESFGLLTPGSMATSAAPAELLIDTNAAGGEYPLVLIARDGDYAATNVVSIPVFVDRIAEAVDTTNIVWSFSGPWYLQTNSTSDGVDALRTDQPPAGSNYWIHTIVTGPGEVRFWWRMIPNPGWGSYAAFQRGNSLIHYTYTTPWTNLSYNVPSGVHTLRWSHINYSVNPVSSAIMVDRITFTPYTNAFMIVSPLSITSSVMEGNSSLILTTFVQNAGVGFMSVTARTTSAWIDIQPSNYTIIGGPFPIRMYPNLDGFTPGVTNAKIVLDAPGAQSGVQTVTVQIVIATNISPSTGSTNFLWSGGGNTPWFAQTNNTHDGISAARSGSIGNNGRTWIEVEAIGPGTLSFWWKVSSEPSWDYLNMYLNGTLTTNRITGEINWQQRLFTFTAGVHRVRWEYAKDTSVAEGLDAAWLDEVIMSGVPDRDADGFPDTWESQFFGNTTGATTSANSDGDPLTNQEEYFAGTDPSDSNSYFRGITQWHVALPPEAVFDTTATGRLYDVWITTNLSNDWTPLNTSFPGNGSNLVIMITNDAAEIFLRSGVRLP